MMQNLAITVLLGLLATEGAAMTAFLGMNMSRSGGRCENKPQGSLHGKNECRCVGVNDLKGYFAVQINYRHIQYPADLGASCAAWDQGTHPECKEGVPPQWCTQKWCYVDPCSCNLEVLPKVTSTDIKYQGQPAYYSYTTCGGMDFWSE